MRELTYAEPRVFAPFGPAVRERERERERQYDRSNAHSDKLRADGRDFFNARELNETQFLFQQCDEDRSGEIDERELVGVLKALNLKRKVPKRRLKRMLTEFDEDGSGQISFDGFCVMVRSIKEGANTSLFDSFVPDIFVKARSTSRDDAAHKDRLPQQLRVTATRRPRQAQLGAEAQAGAKVHGPPAQGLPR